jgi:hypothetical protein
MLLPVAAMVDTIRSCEEPFPHPPSNPSSNPVQPFYSGHFLVLSQWRSDLHQIHGDEIGTMW